MPRYENGRASDIVEAVSGNHGAGRGGLGSCPAGSGGPMEPGEPGGGGRGRRRGGGVPAMAARIDGSACARASSSGLGLVAISSARRVISRPSRACRTACPPAVSESSWRRLSPLTDARPTQPASTSVESSCETAGPETPVRCASSVAPSGSSAIARNARYCDSVKRGSSSPSSRSVQRVTSGAAANRAAAADRGGLCRGDPGGGNIGKYT